MTERIPDSNSDRPNEVEMGAADEVIPSEIARFHKVVASFEDWPSLLGPTNLTNQ